MVYTRNSFAQSVRGGTRHRSAPTISAALTILTLLTAFCGLTPTRADDKPVQHQSSTFSYTTFDVELPLVQVRMNNKLTGTFLIDTGANTSVITDKMAGELGLTPQATYKDGQQYTVAGQPVKAVTVDPMQIGPVNLSVPLSVVPERFLSLLGTHVDGVIGTNILSVFSIFFDFPRHRITLWYPAGLSAEEIKNTGFDRASVLPMTCPSDTGEYLVPVQLQQGDRSAQESLLLDTGGGITGVSKKTAQQLALDPLSRAMQPSLRGSYIASRARLMTLRMGDIKVSNKLVDYPSEDNSSAPSILGMDTLAAYRVLLDFPSKKMYIQTAVPAVNIRPAESIKPAEVKTTKP